MIRYDNFSLIQPNESQILRIQEVIDNFGGSVFHSYSLNKIVSEKFNTELRYLVDNENEFDTVAPVHIIKGKLGLKRYHLKPLYDIPYAGFVGVQDFDSSKLSLGLLDSFEYIEFPNQSKLIEFNEDEKFGETALIDLSSPEEYIFSKIIDSKRRNMIRKAMNHGVEVKIYHNLEGLKKFWPILKDLHIKLGFQHLSYDYYKKIIECGGDNFYAYFLVAFKNATPLSGTFLLGNNSFMHYYKGASVFGKKNNGQGELLQWEGIKLAKRLGIQYYDLCNLEKEKLPHIYKFKIGFSKQIVPYRICYKKRVSYKLMDRINSIVHDD